MQPAMRLAALILAPTLPAITGARAQPAAGRPADEAVLAALDTRYQKALEKNDAATMDAILADGFILVDGDGDSHAKAELIADTRSGKNRYAQQDDIQRTVRVFGDTAVVTAQIRAKGVEGAEPVDYTLWFSAGWTRTPSGWRCVFEQTSQPVES